MRKIKGKVLQDHIAQSGLSLHAWAIQHGFTQPTVYAWITGQKGISDRNVERLEQILGIDRQEFTSIVFRMRPERLKRIEEEQQELLGYFSQLMPVQRERVLRMVQGLAEANRAEQELREDVP